MKKRILSVILVLAMLMTGMLFVNVSAATPDQNAEPGSEAYTAWLVAEGYKPITTYAEFAALANTATPHPTVSGRFVIDGKYYLANDIVMENTTYILAEGDFAGSFDGNGHTIYNFKSFAFDFLTGSWKNVTYSKYTSPEKTEEFDTTASIFWGLDNGGLIENVVNERTFAPVANYWGAFFRTACKDATATVINCVNYSCVSSPYPVNNHKLGGFIGTVDPGVNITFIGCKNYGDITGSQVGGFVGIMKNGTLTFKDCENNGTISGIIGKSSGEGSYGISGGFVGGYNNMNGIEGNVTVNFENCVNNGNVVRLEMNNPSTEPKEVTHGGLIGNLGGAKSDYKMTLNVKDCVIQNCKIGGASSWEDLVNPDTGEMTTDYTQGRAGAIIGWFDNSVAGYVANIENVLVNNVTVQAGDPASASLFINTNSDTSNVAMKNVYAINSTAAYVSTGKYTITNSGTATNVTVNKAQASTPAEGVMNLRFLGSIDSLNYIGMGYLVSITVNGTTTYKVVNTKSVYETVNNGTGTLSKSDFGGNYILAMAIEGEAADVTAVYAVTPYALTEDGNIVTGVTKSITLINGVLN